MRPNITHVDLRYQVVKPPLEFTAETKLQLHVPNNNFNAIVSVSEKLPDKAWDIHAGFIAYLQAEASDTLQLFTLRTWRST